MIISTEHRRSCCRCCNAGLGGSAIICAAFPFYPAEAKVVLGVVSLLGVLAGIAFGSSYQLVSRFGNDESVALTTGHLR